ncbi:MAG: FeoC-like transcriptional regulator [Propionibacteriaceae bacterium]|jgi:hypothetical protein|nr:FeoC-like transcriptional regulator [Propionibacteriaceae bacterium]
MLTASRSPLAVVAEQVASGAPTVAAMADRSGLSESTVRAALDHLVATGQIRQVPLGGCPSGGCAGCSVAGACDLAAPRRPVLLTLA